MIKEQKPDLRRGWGCLVPVAGVVLGLLAEATASDIISSTWSYCTNMPWPEAYDFTDSPRFYLLFNLPLIAAYCCAFPLGFLLATRLLPPSRRRPVRVLTASLAGLLMLSAVLAGDLVYNVAPPDGKYLSARCPHGRPPWWPKPIPLRDSPFADFEHQG
ncbi:hypothetical protein [Streptacidiphilus carbonis]|uniref:hypothetical protein n=1 Tax=Streptacidiphilus carbonis TaxID=105422 RepID=UPI0005AA20FA|nr:hypothetical protein [Streptacidiphilus carbonis]